MSGDWSIYMFKSVRILLSAGFWAGVFVLAQPWVQRGYRIFHSRKRLPDILKPGKRKSFYLHIQNLLETAGRSKMTTPMFFLLSAGLYCFAFGAGLRSGLGAVAIPMGAFSGSLPYMFLRIKLEGMRQKGSFEGEQLVTELLHQYRISGFNIFQALENTVARLERKKICKFLCFQALIHMRNTGNPEAIRQGAGLLYYGIHTNWSRMLANNVRIAAEQGTDVSIAMEDILGQLKQARVAYEERKRLNSEATRMTIYLIPVLYLLTDVVSIQYMGLSLEHFVANQFATPEGVTLFFTAVAMFMLNLMLMEIVNNRRFDY